MSEGHPGAALDAIVTAARPCLLDVHHDVHHNRSVLTLAGEGVEHAARDVTRAAVERLDIRRHTGVHPRIGVVDVVPFVPLAGSTMADAVRARDDFAAWAERTLGLPCERYGPERTLPDVRRAHREHPSRAHPTAGACAVGARPVLVAYNLWLAGADLATARAIAAAVRSPAVRALGFTVGAAVQVSCNLVAPDEYGPAAIYDAVAARSAIDHAELVGLVPASVLHATPPERWPMLDLAEDVTIEARLRSIRR